MNFDDLQAGEQVFLDANIFVYHFLGQSADCRQLLSRCHQGALHGFTASFVVAEVMHRLMRGRSRRKRAGHVFTSRQKIA